jgi:hypothetical protein
VISKSSRVEKRGRATLDAQVRIRVRLLKMGAQIRRRLRNVWVALSHKPAEAGHTWCCLGHSV